MKRSFLCDKKSSIIAFFSLEWLKSYLKIPKINWIKYFLQYMSCHWSANFLWQDCVSKNVNKFDIRATLTYQLEVV